MDKRFLVIGLLIFAGSGIFITLLTPLPSWTAPIVIPINFTGLILIIAGLITNKDDWKFRNSSEESK